MSERTEQIKARLAKATDPVRWVAEDGPERGRFVSDNTEFIANAPEDIAYLLAELGECREHYFALEQNWLRYRKALEAIFNESHKTGVKRSEIADIARTALIGGDAA